jgi:hypothetical protein
MDTNGTIRVPKFAVSGVKIGNKQSIPMTKRSPHAAMLLVLIKDEMVGHAGDVIA